MVTLYQTVPKSRRRFGAILALTFVAFLISLHQYLYVGYSPSFDEFKSYFHGDGAVDEAPDDIVPPSPAPELAAPSSTEQPGPVNTQLGAVVAAGRAQTNLSWMLELQDGQAVCLVTCMLWLT